MKRIDRLRVLPVLLLLPVGTSATPYTPCGAAGRAICVGGLPSPLIPAPRKVPGKEHSTLADRHTGNSPPAPAPGCPPNPGQNVAWDGIGGTDDSFDYEFGPDETDAMANLGDLLYAEVIADAAALLFSVDGSPDVIVEPIAAAGGAPAGFVWATHPVEIESMCPVADVDAVEAWGQDTGGGSDDANRFSRTGDPFDPGLPPGGGRTSVYAHPGATPLCATGALAMSMAPLLGLSPLQEAILAGNMDLDAMMVAGGIVQGPDDDPPPGSAPPMMMWSVRPIMIPPDGPFPPVTLDGGEIFVGDCLGTPAAFLFHGGHVWDTPFPVALSFGLPSENVNALEAVAFSPHVPALPPAGIASLLAMFTAAGVAVLWRRRRRA